MIVPISQRHGDPLQQGSVFDGPLDAVLWRIETERTQIIGAIGVGDCKFYGCRFTRVGVAVPDREYEGFRAGFLE